MRWYIDKDPNNFRYLDLIAAMFPQARVIHCRRGRADTALSIWFQGFARSHYGFANDLADIAEFFDGHDRLMRHWRERSPLPIFTLDYEALIDAPETTLEALRGFIGLPPLPASATSAAPTVVAIRRACGKSASRCTTRRLAAGKSTLRMFRSFAGSETRGLTTLTGFRSGPEPVWREHVGRRASRSSAASRRCGQHGRIGPVENRAIGSMPLVVDGVRSERPMPDAGHRQARRPNQTRW
ncbi:hypothetical protein RLIN73S_03638 [Rhodanobacter lindaniclasticus]